MKARQTIRETTEAPLPNSPGYNISLFFQDYFPGYKRVKLNLRGVLSGGLPQTIPGKGYEAGYFRAPAYKRVDIGLSYQLAGGTDAIMDRGFFRYLKNIWIGVDVFNLLLIIIAVYALFSTFQSKTTKSRVISAAVTVLSIVGLVIQEISAHPESASLAKLAAKYSYNPSYLSTLLRERNGRSFSELVTEQRMLRARTLLENSSLSVASVASLVGYSGTTNFYKKFSAYYGMTPSELRAAHESA